MAELLSRHDLVWLEQSEYAAFRVAEASALPDVVDWIKAGRPAVVRYQGCSDGREIKDGIALGIPFPARLGRRRIALYAPWQTIARREAMPSLQTVLTNAPSASRPLLTQVHRDLDACGLRVRVYGSLGWEYLTGENYLHPDSDLDMILDPSSGFDPDRAAKILTEIAAIDAPRFDGELLVAPGRAVAWREWLARPKDILVRGLHTLRLEPWETAVGHMLPRQVAGC